MPLETEYNQLVEKRKKILEEMKQTEEILHKLSDEMFECSSRINSIVKQMEETQ